MTSAAAQYGKDLSNFWKSIETRNYCHEAAKAHGINSVES